MIGNINGYGIRNMQDRAREAGFQLHINSTKEGTTVFIERKE
jgi:signal transduction histidine kinase